jgi:hypothetical protein
MDGHNPSFEEIELLVKSLLRPGPSHNVQKLGVQFQELQRSPQGWQIADFLLSRDDAQVRFYGALTFQIKLNNDT